MTVHVACGMINKSKKDGVLNSKTNKQRTIHYLIYGHSREDNEQIMQIMMPMTIVQTAVSSARYKATVLNGDHTDLLKWMRISYS